MAKKRLNQDVLIELIEFGAGTQWRPLNSDTIDHYLALLEDGVEFPPVECVFDGKSYYVWDGYHRLECARRREEKSIRANVEVANQEHAQWLSFSANATHGLPRQKGAMKIILADIFAKPKWAAKSDSELARHIGVSRQYVGQVRAEILDSESETQDAHGATTCTIAVKRKGKKYRQKSQRRERNPKSPVSDDEGQEIPARLAPRWVTRAVVSKKIRALDQIKNAIMHSIENGDLTWSLLHQAGFLAEYDTLRARLKSALAHAICPYCKGQGCKACHNFGFVNKPTYENAPKDE